MKTNLLLYQNIFLRGDMLYEDRIMTLMMTKIIIIKNFSMIKQNIEDICHGLYKHIELQQRHYNKYNNLF
jgi:hypothetical protein